MKKVTIKAPESESEIEKLRKIYRLIGDVVSKHDAILRKNERIEEIFLYDALLLRDRLMEYCEKLILSTATELREKAEEVLWRKCFYNVIKHIRKAGKIVDSNLLNAYWLHLKSACGFYLQLLMRLQYDFNLTFPSDLSPALIPRSLRRCSNVNENSQSADLHTWATNLSHKCLIYLGDLARYESDCFDIGLKIVAQRYYYQAIMLNPYNGIGYNQLGSLASHTNSNMNAAYYYLRSLLCRFPFEGSSTNLVKLLEANNIIYQRNNSTADIQSLQKNNVKKMIINFLMLVYCLYTDKSNVHGREVRQICECVLLNLNICLPISSQHSNNVDTQACSKLHINKVEGDVVDKSPVEMMKKQIEGQIEGASKHGSVDKLEGDTILRILLILIAAIHLNIQQRGSEFGAGIAVGLSIFSHILHCVNINLISQFNNSLLRKNEKDILEKKDLIPDTQQPKHKRNNTKIQKLRMLRRGRGDNEGSEDSGASSSLSDHSSQESLRSEDELNADELSNKSSQSINRWSNSSSQSENLDNDHDKSSSNPHKIDEPIDALDKAIDGLSLILPEDNDITVKTNIELTNNENSKNNGSKNIISFDWSKYENFTKEISVPPGFESSMEMIDVAELSTKLANFDIDTDTDTQLTDGEYDSNSRVRLCVDGTADLLPSILIFSHWLIANPDVITNCAQVSSNIWTRLSILLNLFPNEEKLLKTVEMTQLESHLNGGTLESSLFTLELPEEFHLNYFPPIPNFPSINDTNVDSTFKKLHLNNHQQAILRMWRMRKFGHKVCEMNSVGLHFNISNQQFHYTKPIINQLQINNLSMLEITPINKKKLSNSVNLLNLNTIIKDRSLNYSINNNNLTCDTSNKNGSAKALEENVIISKTEQKLDTRTASQIFVQQFYSNMNHQKEVDQICDDDRDIKSCEINSHLGNFLYDDFKDISENFNENNQNIFSAKSIFLDELDNEVNQLSHVNRHEDASSFYTDDSHLVDSTLNNYSHQENLIPVKRISPNENVPSYSPDKIIQSQVYSLVNTEIAADNNLLKINDMLNSGCCVTDTPSSQFAENFSPANSKSENDIREATMRSMAKLWLQSDVSRLEGKASSMSKIIGRRSFCPVFAIIDADIKPNQLNQLLNLANKNRFTLIVPNAVVVELDFLKKEHAYARDVIRILEKQFLRGHKWLQAQKKAETINCFDIQKQITDKHLQYLIELVNCAQFYSNLQNISKNKLDTGILRSNQEETSKLNSPESFGSSSQTEISSDLNSKINHVIGSTNEDIAEKADFVVLLLCENSQLKLNEHPPLKNPTFTTLTAIKFINNFKT